MEKKTCVCAFCGHLLPTTDEVYEYCPECEDEMEVVVIEETDTRKIDNHTYGISQFITLDLKTQYAYIMASDGTENEKLSKLCECIERV